MQKTIRTIQYLLLNIPTNNHIRIFKQVLKIFLLKQREYKTQLNSNRENALIEF